MMPSGKPCLCMSCCNSTVPWASFSMGKTTSSMTTVVPGPRTAPTAGNRPLRMFQRRLKSSGLSMNTMGCKAVMPATSSWISPICASSVFSSAARVSTRMAAASSGSSLRKAGMPGLSCTDLSEARSMSSTAETGPFLSMMVALQASAMAG